MKTLPQQIAELRAHISSDEKDIGQLVEALSDPSVSVQHEAQNLLASLGAAAIPALEGALESGHGDRAAGALGSAIRMGPVGKSVVIRALSSIDDSLLSLALQASPHQIFPEGAASLISLLDRFSDQMSLQAVRLLAASRETDYQQQVETALWDYLEKKCFHRERAGETAAAGIAAPARGSSDKGWFLAAGVLGALQGPRVRELVCPLLATNDPVAKAVAASALGGSADKESARDLIKLLQSSSPLVQEASFDALVTAGRDMLGLLKAVFQKSPATLKERVLSVMLAIMGNTSLSLVKRLFAAGADHHLMALRALRGMREAEIVPLLVQSLGDSSSAVSREASRRLVELGTLAIRPLSACLRDAPASVSGHIGVVLARIGPAASCEIAKLLKTGDDQVRLRIVNSVNFAPDADLIKTLTTLLTEGGDRVRREAARILGKGGTIAVPGLVDAALSNDVTGWRWAVIALKQCGDGWKSWLTEELKEDDPDRREKAVKLLGRMSLVVSCEEFLSAAEKLQPAEVDRAVKEVKQHAPAGFYSTIVDRLDTFKGSSHEFLVKGLITVALPLVEERILDRLADEEDPWVMQFLLSALGGAGAEQAMPLILSMLDHDNDSVRFAAVSALSQSSFDGKKAPLLRRAKETEGEERIHILEALADIGDEEIYTVFFSTYRDSDEKGREKVASLFRANPSVELVSSGIKRMAIEAETGAEIFQNMLSVVIIAEEQMNMLKTMTQDRNPKIRSAVYMVLETIGSDESFILLVEACRSEGDPALHHQLFGRLVREMLGGKAGCRQPMEQYIKEMGAEAAVPLLEVMAELNTGDFMFMALSQLIESMGETALDILDTLGEDDDRRIATAATDLADTIRRSLLVGT